MTWSNLSLQDSNNPLMEQLTLFHDHILMILILITSFTAYILLTNPIKHPCNYLFTEQQFTELMWTISPMIIILFLAFPSIHLLYLMEENIHPTLTVKVIGHQWYWSYEYADFMNKEIDAYLKPISQTDYSHYRLLDTTTQLTLPLANHIRLIITSLDVLHSWSVPSLGMKMDAVPGRLNQLNLFMNRPGLFYGQCSEICGINHSFMPICIESVNLSNFLKWTTNQ